MGKTDVQLHSFVTSAVEGGACSASCSGLMNPGEKRPRRHAGWVGPTADLDFLENNRPSTLAALKFRIVQPSVTQSGCTICDERLAVSGKGKKDGTGGAFRSLHPLNGL